MSRVSYSQKHAKTVHAALTEAEDWLDHHGDHENDDGARHLLALVRGAERIMAAPLAPRRAKPIAIASRKVKAEKKQSKRERWHEVRDAVYERAGGYCECGCSKPFVGFRGARTPDHFFGKARAESIETVWALRVACHEAKTLNNPSAEHWRDRFVLHCERHGYREAAERARALTERDLLVLQAAAISAEARR